MLQEVQGVSRMGGRWDARSDRPVSRTCGSGVETGRVVPQEVAPAVPRLVSTSQRTVPLLLHSGCRINLGVMG